MVHTSNKFTHLIAIIILPFITHLVCAENFYQTSNAGDTLMCASCPTGSSTGGLTDQTACGMYDKKAISILRYH